MASACAIRTRCCSPPESTPTGQVGVGRRADRGERVSTTRRAGRRCGRPMPQRCPSMPWPHDVARAQRRQRVEAALLRARSRSSALPRRAGCAVDQHLSGRQRLQSEDRAQQAGLAGAVRAEHGEELAGLRPAGRARATVRVRRSRGAASRSSRTGVIARAPSSARRGSLASRPGSRCRLGSVSVTGTAGTSSACAAASTRVVSAPAVCAL